MKPSSPTPALTPIRTRIKICGLTREEDVDAVGHEAGQLGLLGLPVFVFQEGDDRAASRLFPQIAKLTRGAYCKFDRSSPDQLKRLLGAVAAYAAGGRSALLKYGRDQGGAAALLTNQMK